MKFTACSAKETTCTTVLHSIQKKNELIQGFKKSVYSQAEGEGEWMYLVDAFEKWEVWGELTTKQSLVSSLVSKPHL